MHDGLLISVGERVRLFRKRKQLSQIALSERSGIDRTYLSDIENGKRNISLLTLNNLALALDVPIEMLVSRPPVTL
ncbi:transcriptional regulator with XRE-family HTH domain [Erwinia persicina]|uniref:Helix-turn-helix domain-containing protein n=2 Tax=Erwinia TaxID=551 RepID=A0ABV4E394_9GAMM|nr:MULTISPECIES: helix-turn-helix transcriptional regulator [Erwinia]MCP1436895.1 transcriptional regulator with XRE-family HTH domain [Erwinia persicina]MDN4625857.1 helix-turn-helix transcriptional regulator [Erwinia sp. PsM31]MDN8540263.1 helix-turn-helix transcriptional regulator [Erwinia sp. BC051422]